MRCEEIQARFEDYRGGELPPELAREVAGELETCPHCRQAWTWFVATGELTRRWAAARAEQLPEGAIWEAIAGELEDDAAAVRRPAPAALPWREKLRAWVRSARWAWVGASLAAAAAAAWFAWVAPSLRDEASSSAGPALVAQHEPPDNEAEILEIEVRRGVVWIDQPDDPTQPLVVGVIEEGDAADVPTGG